MGGNAIKNVPTRRYERAEYLRIEGAVVEKLLNDSGVTRAVAIPAYRQKETFGDCDVLVSSPPHIDSEMTVRTLFNPAELNVNGGVYSFPVEELQIDVIRVPDALFDMALAYYSYNVLGNLMGRVAHRMGLKYGHQGLVYPVRYNGTHELGEIALSTNPAEIFSFLGWDYSVFKAGFASLTDVFRYVASGDFFAPKLFPLENLNHIHRTRNRKRKAYMEFLVWVNGARDEYDEHDYHDALTYDHGVVGPDETAEAKSKRLSGWLDFTDKSFPRVALKETVAKMIQGASAYKSARERVLASAARLGLKDQALGELMAKIRKLTVRNELFCAWVQENSGDLDHAVRFQANRR